MSCGISWLDEIPQELATRRLSAAPRKNSLFEKAGSWAFS
jgi:hypothetical protein